MTEEKPGYDSLYEALDGLVEKWVEERLAAGKTSDDILGDVVVAVTKLMGHALASHTAYACKCCAHHKTLALMRVHTASAERAVQRRLYAPRD